MIKNLSAKEVGKFYGTFGDTFQISNTTRNLKCPYCGGEVSYFHGGVTTVIIDGYFYCMKDFAHQLIPLRVKSMIEYGLQSIPFGIKEGYILCWKNETNKEKWRKDDYSFWEYLNGRAER